MKARAVLLAAPFPCVQDLPIFEMRCMLCVFVCACISVYVCVCCVCVCVCVSVCECERFVSMCARGLCTYVCLCVSVLFMGCTCIRLLCHKRAGH